MDFSLEYTEEQESFAVEVNAWLDENVPDGLEHIRDPLKMNDQQWQLRRDFTRTLGKKGWLYPSFSKQYGGGGLDGSEYFVLAKEIGKRGLTITPLYDMGVLVSPAIQAVGTEEQKNRLLPQILTGEKLVWQLFTEPEAGTDAANQHTESLRSKREGNKFIVNGHKVFVGSYPSKPELLYLLTRSDADAPRHFNLTSFLIPADLPGITVQALDLFIQSTIGSQFGVTGANVEGVKHAVYFDNVEVDESYMIGEEGQGWAVTTATLEVEHGGGGAGSAERSTRGRGGPVRENLLARKFFEICRTDPGVRRRIESNPQVQESVIEVYINTQIQRLIQLRNINGRGGHYGGPQASLMEKMWGTQLIKHFAKVLGPGVFTDDPEWLIDDGRFETSQRCGMCLAPGGTPESYKINISRALNMGRK